MIDESQGVFLARALANHGARVVAHDPLAAPFAAQVLKDQAVVLDSLADCLAQASIVVVTTPDPVYAALGLNDFAAGHDSPVTVVDCWRLP